MSTQKTAVPAGKPKKQGKTKINKKRLMFVFLTAFAGFFLLCTMIASMLAPKIDIPEASNDEDLSTMSSDDFKGRVDGSLRQIEMTEDSGGASNQSTGASKVNEVLQDAVTDQPVQKPVVAPKQKVAKQPVKYTREDNYEQVPYDSRSDDSNSYEPPTAGSEDDNTLILRDKIKPEQNSN